MEGPRVAFSFFRLTCPCPPTQLPLYNACVGFCSNFNPEPIPLHSHRSRPLRQPSKGGLYDKVIQRQLWALISGLNPVSAGACLSPPLLPGLPSLCPTLTIWSTVTKTKCLSFHSNWPLDKSQRTVLSFFCVEQSR